MATTLYLAWQDPVGRSWFPIGRLSMHPAGYEFAYTHGAREARSAGFLPLPGFPDLHGVYYSAELFPVFSNRLLPRSRPEFNEYVRWLSVPEPVEDPFVLLARGGGHRVTDTFEVFPQPELDEAGNYHIHFFVHGLRHFSQSSQLRAAQLTAGERLYLMHDLQNPWDRNALVLRTAETKPGDLHLVGFCPRYLSQDVVELGLAVGQDEPEVVVHRVNSPPAPIQFRVLCRLSISASGGYRPFSSSLYQPIPSDALAAAVD
jgi:hypothetical protein